MAIQGETMAQAKTLSDTELQRALDIKHHKKKKNAMSGSEEQANAVGF
jgi:hypothetical protein